MSRPAKHFILSLPLFPVITCGLGWMGRKVPWCSAISSASGGPAHVPAERPFLGWVEEAGKNLPALGCQAFWVQSQGISSPHRDPHRDLAHQTLPTGLTSSYCPNTCSVHLLSPFDGIKCKIDMPAQPFLILYSNFYPLL